MADPVETHATLKSTKYFLNKNQSDLSIDDRLKAEFVPAGSIWLELELGYSPTKTSTTEMIASKYAAGLWQQTNAMDKSKETQYMIDAKADLVLLKRNLNIRTFPSTSYDSEIPSIDF